MSVKHEYPFYLFRILYLDASSLQIMQILRSLRNTAPQNKPQAWIHRLGDVACMSKMECSHSQEAPQAQLHQSEVKEGRTAHMSQVLRLNEECTLHAALVVSAFGAAITRLTNPSNGITPTACAPGPQTTPKESKGLHGATLLRTSALNTDQLPQLVAEVLCSTSVPKLPYQQSPTSSRACTQPVTGLIWTTFSLFETHIGCV